MKFPRRRRIPIFERFSHPDNQQAYTVLAHLHTLLKKQVPKVSVLVMQVCGLFLLVKDDPTTMSRPLDLLQKSPESPCLFGSFALLMYPIPIPSNTCG